MKVIFKVGRAIPNKNELHKIHNGHSIQSRHNQNKKEDLPLAYEFKICKTQILKMILVENQNIVKCFKSLSFSKSTFYLLKNKSV